MKSYFNNIIANNSTLIKLFNWEYWNFGVLYTPIYFYWAYLSVKAKSLFFFSASNPSIENGGFLMERKSDIYNIIPINLQPKTILINAELSTSEINEFILKNDFVFPLIVKPDIGGKGRGVKKIYNITDVIKYIKESNFPMLVQNLIEYKNEVGVFYYRYPWEKNGKISGVVSKEAVIIIGDGKSTIEELITKNERYFLQIDALKKIKEINFSEIIKNNEERVLLSFGNHARGSKFVDATSLVTPEFENTIDEICKSIPGFYFGRLDIMYNNWDELSKGKNISIIELNGAGSEPTHIYDTKHSVFFAWKEIIRHLKILFEISTYNKKNNIGKYLSYQQGMKMFRDNSNIEKKLNALL